MKPKPTLAARGRTHLAIGAGLLATLLFAWLGFWQLERAEAKAARAAAYTQALQQAPIALPPARAALAVEGMRVRAQGEWLAQRTVWIDNRSHKGRNGVHVLTPLRLASGEELYVNRGWAPRAARDTALPSPPLPAGVVQVQGLAQRPLQRGFTLGTADAAQTSLWPVLDAQHLGAASAKAYPLYVQLEAPAADALVREWAPAAAGADKHRAYAVQWFAFAIIAAGLSLAALRRLWRGARDD